MYQCSIWRVSHNKNLNSQKPMKLLTDCFCGIHCQQCLLPTVAINWVKVHNFPRQLYCTQELKGRLDMGGLESPVLWQWSSMFLYLKSRACPTWHRPKQFWLPGWDVHRTVVLNNPTTSPNTSKVMSTFQTLLPLLEFKTLYFQSKLCSTCYSRREHTYALLWSVQQWTAWQNTDRALQKGN